MKTILHSILLFSLLLLFSNAQDAAIVSPEGEAKVSDTSNDTSKAEQEAVVREQSSDKKEQTVTSNKTPVQSGPWIDLLGPKLVSLNMIDETHAQLEEHYTNEALSGKKVVSSFSIIL